MNGIGAVMTRLRPLAVPQVVMQDMKLHLFGHPELRRGDEPLAIGRRHVLALLAILAETARPLPRGRVAEMLWPETDEATVRARLRRLMHRLSEAAGRDAIVTAGETIGLDPGIAVDSRDFFTLAEAGLRMRDAGTLRRATELHSAPFLDGFELPHAEGFSDWVLARRAELERLQARALRMLAEVDADAGDCDAAISAAARLLALDPLREQSHRLLMRLHARAGDADRLEAAFRHCVQVLADELGVAPSRETQSEYGRLRGAVTAPDPFPPAIRFAAADGGSVAFSIFGKG
jgi:DNA-binding SARP family transcriptional activator